MVTRGSSLLRKWIDDQKFKTDKEAAATLGCSSALLCHWLQGTRQPGRDWCFSIARTTAGAVPAEAWVSTPLNLTRASR